MKSSAQKRLIPKQPIDDGLIDFEEVQKNRELLSLRQYQTNHLGFFLKEWRSIDRSDAGTGKTPVMCLWLYARSQEDRCIWAMPKSLLSKNYEELLLWSNLQPHQIVLVDGTPDQRKKQMDWKDGRVFMMGFDTFANNWEYLRSKYSNVVHFCGDEFHRGFSTHGVRNWRNPLKFDGPRRTVMLYEFLHKGGSMLATTGTLINGRLTSAFPVIHLINPVYYGTYTTFESWHCILDNWGKPIMYKNHDRLSAILDKHGRRITYQEAYGEENKQIFVIQCNMGVNQKKAYKQFEERAILELEDGFIESKSSATTLRKCMELMQVPELFDIQDNNDDGKEAHLQDEVELAIEEKQQLLIFDPIKNAQVKWARILNDMGRKAEVMNGDVTGTQRMWQDKRFREGEITDLVCSPDVAGVGFNWEHVNTVIFMMLDWQDTTFIQNYRRALRGTRTQPLRILVFQYRASIDQKIAQKLNWKSENRLRVEGGTEVNIGDKPKVDKTSLSMADIVKTGTN